MKVFILKAHYDYEGYSIIGIYLSRKDAEKRKESVGENNYDQITIDEHPVGEGKHETH